jgi:hypothetical protein
MKSNTIRMLHLLIYDYSFSPNINNTKVLRTITFFSIDVLLHFSVRLVCTFNCQLCIKATGGLVVTSNW